MDSDLRERVAGLSLGMMLLVKQLSERDAALGSGLERLIKTALNRMTPEERASGYGGVLDAMVAAIEAGRDE